METQTKPKQTWNGVQSGQVPSYPGPDQLRRVDLFRRPGDIFKVEEKIDGSQFGFMRRPKGNMTLAVRSHNRVFEIGQQDHMFDSVIKSISEITELLNPDYIYYGEMVHNRGHCTLTYNRNPARFFVLFDIRRISDGTWLNTSELNDEGYRLGLEVVPVLYEGPADLAKIQSLMEGPCVLLGGDSQREGIVIKRVQARSTVEGQFVPSAKLVSDKFKEAHDVHFKTNDDGSVIRSLISAMANKGAKARLQKAKQHLAEDAGVTTPTREQLIDEAKRDFEADMKTEIAEALLAHYYPRFEAALVKSLIAAITYAENAAASAEATADALAATLQ